MKALSVFAGTLALAAALSSPAYAQPQFCMTDNVGRTWTLFLDEPTDIFLGTVIVSSLNFYATGSRGTTSTSARHHHFTAMNVNAGSGCTGANGLVNWFTYNGTVAPLGGGAYSFSGRFFDSCGATGTATAAISPGTCRVQGTPVPAPVPRDPATATGVEE
jgi:hypothetical protein